MPDAKPEEAVQQSSGLGCLLRLVWMLVGNAAALLSAIWIALNAGRSLFCAVDIVYSAAVLAVIVCRYLDIRYCAGTTDSGEPATMRNWRRHTIWAVGGGLLAWGAAHGIAFALAK